MRRLIIVLLLLGFIAWFSTDFYLGQAPPALSWALLALVAWLVIGEHRPGEDRRR